jgi:putative FmdB family regulatory protein
MPLYEYQCDACERRFELIVKFSDPPVETCPTCGGHVHKLMSSPAFQFKGTGWYVTDYARKDQGATGKSTGSQSEASEKAKDESSSSAKSDQPAKGESGSSSSDSSSAPSTPAPAASTTSSPKKD